MYVAIVSVTCYRLTEMLSCPLEVARQMTLIAHGEENILCVCMIVQAKPNIDGAITFAHICVDSSQTVLEHHRHVACTFGCHYY